MGGGVDAPPIQYNRTADAVDTAYFAIGRSCLRAPVGRDQALDRLHGRAATSECVRCSSLRIVVENQLGRLPAGLACARTRRHKVTDRIGNACLLQQIGEVLPTAPGADRGLAGPKSVLGLGAKRGEDPCQARKRS